MKKLLITLSLIALITVAGCAAPIVEANNPEPTQTTQPTTTTPVISDPATPPEDNINLTEEEARQQAYDFITNSPTFAFDGMPETLELVDTIILKCVGCYTFVYEFDCRHGGYGDRTGQMVTQAITHHRAVIDFRRGELTGAVLDEAWDMQAQMMIATEEESLELAREYLENSPTFTFDGIEGSIRYVETRDTFGFYSWGFVFEFDCGNAGYGDRSDQMVATVMTHHTAEINVSGGEITGGVIDGKWDMETQQTVPTASPHVSTATAP
jgi:hypothetical protein